MLWLRIKTDGHLHLVQKFLGIIADEFKTVAFSCSGVVVHNGIVKSSGGSDDRDRPIFQTIDLIQTTGLIFRGHQEEIRSGFDFVSQSVVIGDSNPGFLRVFASNLGEEIVVFLFSCSKENEPDVEGEQLVQNFCQKVESFLICQPGDHPQKREVLKGRRKIEYLKEILFTFSLSREILGVVAGDQVRVVRGVPILVVHTIEDAVKGLLSLSQDSFQSITVFRGLDLFAILSDLLY